MHVVATAGHVDHGKSTLVHALTGIDPDRFGEEKARGLTIDLGFAWTTLPSGRGLAFVDVPGHIRFIKNMLAGVGAVDACLFVVAATESWKPQSEEHLRILELLGVSHGLVALTKVAIVDDDHRELAGMDVADHLAGTFLEGAEVVEVDAPSGGGLDELRAALDRLLAATPTAVDVGRPRLWVDRSFAAKGSGTVVTGTLTGGGLAVEDELVVVPADRSVRIRSLQSHQESLPAVGPGRRVAVNVVGVAHDEVERGDALVRPGQWHLTRRIDASLGVLASLDHEVSRRGAYVAYLGSGERPARLRVLGSSALAPGESGLVRLHLAQGLPLVPGDRYVLRETGRAETVGGGEVLDVDPILPAARARPDRSLARVVAERGWVEADLLSLLTGVAQAPELGPWVVDPSALARTRQTVEEAVDAAGPLGLDVAGLDPRQRAVLATLDDVAIDAGRARRPELVDPLVDHPYLDVLDASPFTPPAPDGVDRSELRELVRRGLVLESDGTWFSPGAVPRAAAILVPLLATHPEGVTVAQIRDALGTSRKFLLPLLALLDGRGITRRRGDVRIAGPRLSDVGAGP
ncbi:MAG: selenocysteine-specific translation elongation factor [Actinomycetota bacterium]|jgi:selenocysteine-specific elongation factor|nr:selenocysteine-specific translation elongation factor [Actinomycetota bacterium]